MDSKNTDHSNVDDTDLNEAKNLLSDLADLDDKDSDRAIRAIENMPEKILEAINAIGPFLEGLGDGLEQEIRIIVYDDVAKLLAKKFDLEPVAIRAWIIQQVEDSYPFSTEERTLAAQANDLLSRAKIAVRCKYINHGKGKYQRIAQVYLGRTDQKDKVDKLESECNVTMDELPTEATEAFNIHGKTAYEFSIL